MRVHPPWVWGATLSPPPRVTSCVRGGWGRNRVNSLVGFITTFTPGNPSKTVLQLQTPCGFLCSRLAAAQRMKGLRGSARDPRPHKTSLS